MGSGISLTNLPMPPGKNTLSPWTNAVLLLKYDMLQPDGYAPGGGFHGCHGVRLDERTAEPRFNLPDPGISPPELLQNKTFHNAK